MTPAKHTRSKDEQQSLLQQLAENEENEANMASDGESQTAPQDGVTDLDDYYVDVTGIRKEGQQYRTTYIEMIDSMERIEEYKPGGFHPVHIRDELKGGRYTIVHKLGYGGLSTVWLSRDNTLEKYVAIKISLADSFKDETKTAEILEHIKEKTRGHPLSSVFSLPLENFEVEGPNGRHLCNVFPLSGPSIARYASENLGGEIGLGLEECQRSSLQITQAVAFLHSPGVEVVHGDLTANNILFDINNLDHLSVEQIYEIVGEPYALPMEMWTGEPLTPSAPTYVVCSVNPQTLFPYRTGNIKIADFGSSFRFDTPPLDLGIPAAYRSPELILHNTISKEVDVWALASVIFKIRDFGSLIECWSNWDGEALDSMKHTMGPIPEEMLSGDWLEHGLADPPNEEEDEPFRVKGRLWEATKTVRVPYRPEVDYDFNIQVTTGLSKLWNYFMFYYTWRPWHAKGVIQEATMSNEELEIFNDLISRILVYEVEKRPTAAQLLHHPWFSRVFEKPSLKEWKEDK